MDVDNRTMKSFQAAILRLGAALYLKKIRDAHRP
jgi:hypothetical protein